MNNTGKVLMPDGRMLTQQQYLFYQKREQEKKARYEALMKEVGEASEEFKNRVDEIKKLSYPGEKNGILVQGNIGLVDGVSQIILHNCVGSGTYEGVGMSEVSPIIDAINDMLVKLMKDIDAAGARQKAAIAAVQELTGTGTPAEEQETEDTDTNSGDQEQVAPSSAA